MGITPANDKLGALDEADERAFNETLKRMLATKPTPHEKPDSQPAQRKARDDKSTSEQRE